MQLLCSIAVSFASESANRCAPPAAAFTAPITGPGFSRSVRLRRDVALKNFTEQKKIN